MSLERPENIEEWREYIATLEGDALREKTVAANTVAFVRLLMDEGLSAKDVHAVFIALAERFQQTGQRTPAEGFYNLDALLLQSGP